MKSACQSFRNLLEQKLAGRSAPRELTQLSWHEHLVGCASCRALLESEEALEVLLATLPDPKLSPDVKRRVLAALARSRAADGSLDRLLELDAEATAPAALASNVLARLAEERKLARAHSKSDALDTLLDRDRSIATPKHLAQRVLARLEHERTELVASSGARLDTLLDRAGRVDDKRELAQRVLEGLAAARRPARRPLTLLRAPWLFAAAASLVAGLFLWSIWSKPSAPKAPEFVRDGVRATQGSDTQLAAAPDAQMLAAMDVLENWDLLMQGDVDVLLSTIEPVDEALLDYDDEG